MQFTSTLIVALLAVSSFPTRTTAQQVSNLRGGGRTGGPGRALFGDCPFFDLPQPKHDIRMPNYDEVWVKKCQQTTGCVSTCPKGQILCGLIRRSDIFDGLYCEVGKY